MDAKELQKTIRQFGKFERAGARPSQKVYSVQCTVCGGKICSDIVGLAGASVTKRGTAVFWCGPKCEKGVWDSRIK